METHKVTCHFCSLQDYFALSADSVQNSANYNPRHSIKAHYTGERPICPRGNYCIELAQHKKRLGYCRIESETAKTKEALDYLDEKLHGIDTTKTAILLSGSLPLEIALLTAKLGKAWNTKYIAQIAAEDEIVAKFLNNFSFDSLNEKQIVLSIGDIFSLHPSIARAIHDARFSGKKRFLATIDICTSRTSRFAWSNLIANPNRVADIVEALFKAVAQENYSIEGTGVEKPVFENLAASLGKAESAAILFAPGVARFTEPERIAFWAKKLADSRKFDFATFSTGSNGRGISRILNSSGFVSTTEVLAAIGNGDIEALMCLGCDPIEAFPGIYGRIKNMKLVAATAAFRTAIVDNANIVLPAKYLFERKGALLSLEEKIVVMDDPLPSPDYPGEEAILNYLLKKENIDISLEQSMIRQQLDSFQFASGEPDRKELSNANLLAIGYHVPHHHGDGSLTRRSSWVERQAGESDNSVIVGMELADKLGVRNGDSVIVTTDSGKSEFGVIIEEDRLDDIILVPAYMPNGRSILGWCNAAGFVPIEAKIEKA